MADRKTTGIFAWPPNMYRFLATWFTNWSMAM